MAKETLGQKIRKYRLSRNVSQMDLELNIGAAPGSISRIESGKINPTKETLLKIVKALDIQSAEAAELFSIDLNDIIAGFSKVSTVLDMNFNLDKILKMIVCEIVPVVNGYYASIWLWDEKDRRLTMKFHNVPKFIVRIVEKAMGRSIDGVSLSADDPNERENYALKCLMERKILETDDLYNYVHTFVNRNIAKIVQRIVGMKYSLAVPLIIGNKKIGVLDIVLKKKLVGQIDESMLELFINQISRAILYAEEYQKLKDKLLKTKIRK